ncbi:MAG TPA: protein phosphatase 2C domain-containing protein [Ktedonobacteraceae bacterium]|nr:protein phosphatase 2C domain-containing protein [Ktedonobacteraceae bacterium]
MLCPQCHTQNRENAKFCKGCGLSFTPEMLAAAQAPAEATEAEQVENIPSPPPAPEQAGSASSSQESPSEQATQAAVVTEPGTTATSTEPVDDITQAPTQILTPQQMLAYHAKRWQHDLEREQQELAHAQQAVQEPDEEQRKAIISNTPTVLFASPGQDVGELPTVIVPPENSAPPPPPPPPESLTPDASTEAHVENQATSVGEPVPSATPEVAPDTTSSPTAAEVPASEPTATSQENVMEQGTPSQPAAQATEQSQTQEQPEAQGQPQPTEQPAQTTETANFPVLAVGTTLVGGRYEVAQVLSDAQEEHVYLVTDHQGYQRCWNCGTQENGEGDEFCIDCGAELLNASYTLHEYPAEESKNNEANVLQGVIVNTFVEQGHTYVVEQPQVVQNAFPNGVHLLVASDSDAGNVRRSEPNEDSTLVLQLQRIHESISKPVGVFIVADGMGGHDNGQGASLMTIGVIAERMVRELMTAPLLAEKNGEQPKQLDEEALVTLLNGAVEDANTALCQTNQREKSDMGSTITGFMVVGDHAYILNVGDSRTYMLREGKLHQLTNDHSLVGQLVAGGLIEPDDVYTHPQRSQIYRSLGDKLNVQVDIFKQQVYPGDILLSCSDGLWEMIRNPQITDILSNASDPQSACSQLIETANANGGEDNVSAVVVFVR